ncbi:unnamed protein product [Bursaphelenchus xylophilus]|uniref:(pine wood nematode) hypothetical protein n=1 Tax=Bursaphelenchus xylophilus TaxID=6326 RepID=A0A1I7ST68_BURXY|nr:unnamed protein product [Bursaphelenchus xylophilus]CAG9108687.1 unnamed protein product [Bursaphelenchus xylophilus]
MVITTSTAIPTVHSEIRLNSNRTLRYVAPFLIDKNYLTDGTTIKRKVSESQDDNESWEGVLDMCQAMDDIIEIDKESELMAEKSVLEIGFCTGLPSVFALDSGASDVTIHAWSSTALEFYVKPTMKRNKVPKNICKFNSSILKSTIQSLGGKKFDVIVAPELLQMDETDFEEVHGILDAALKPFGIVLICSRSYYPHCSGNIPAFMEMCKMKGVFDAYLRWSSTKPDQDSHRVIQLTRTLR